MTTSATQTHVSWPLCPDCHGAGALLLDARFNRLSNDPCPTCQGAGRVSPPDWRDPVWEPPAADGSHPGYLVDPGTHPELLAHVKSGQIVLKDGTKRPPYVYDQAAVIKAADDARKDSEMTSLRAVNEALQKELDDLKAAQVPKPSDPQAPAPTGGA